MYQEIILDHYRHPHHKGLREPFDAEVHHVNPTCGDEVTVRVRLSSIEASTADDAADDSGGKGVGATSGAATSAAGGPATSGAATSAAGGPATSGAATSAADGAATSGAATSAAGTFGGDMQVADVSFDALGCSISQASASVMTDLVIGKTVEEALAVGDEFLALMQTRGDAEPDEDLLEDAVAFAGVAKYPARVKCALLGWMAWKDATARALNEKAGQAP